MLLFSIIFLSSSLVYSNSAEHLYLDLMKKCLINSIYQDAGCKEGEGNYQKWIRENGLDWPSVAHTMIGLHRLNNLQFCVEDVLKNNIPGDLIETGVWRGGATIFMRAILKAYGNTEKKVWVADSFEGLPVPKPSIYPADTGIRLHTYRQLAVSLDQVQNNFRLYNLLDDQVAFLKGWFSETLPSAPIEKIAVMRLDGDLYESTMDALVNLYPKLSIGGYVIVDDYGMESCRSAIHDFRKKFGITDQIHHIENAESYKEAYPAIFWRRSK